MLKSASAPHAWGTAVPALLFSQLIAITRCSLVTYKVQLSPVILSSEVFANLSVCKQRGHLDTFFYVLS